MKRWLYSALFIAAFYAPSAYANPCPPPQPCPQVATAALAIPFDPIVCPGYCSVISIFGGHFVDVWFPNGEMGSRYNPFQFGNEAGCAQTARALCFPVSSPRHCDIIALTRDPSDPFQPPFPSGTVYVHCP